MKSTENSRKLSNMPRVPIVGLVFWTQYLTDPGFLGFDKAAVKRRVESAESHP